MDGRGWLRPPRSRLEGRELVVLVAMAACLAAGEARATFKYGDIQISGNLSAQQLIRIQDGSSTFSAFNPVQQRNTFRLQYEHQLANGGNLLNGMAQLPFIRDINLLAYYRFVYDSIYDIAPGPTLETQSGATGGKISDLRSSARNQVAFENVLREFYVDINTRSPFSFRIGRQQIVWGEALGFRALDSVNALDLSWHLQQEAGLLGKVGFDELRIPAWTFKMLGNFGTIGPLSQVYGELFDIPFDFQPAYARFLPAPWSVPVRNPFRGGLVLDAGAAVGLPVPLLLQPCFDFTGNPAPQTGPGATADPDFTDTAVTGKCPSRGLQKSKITQGIYGRHDVMDVNQFGGRLGFVAPGNLNMSLGYMHRRQLGADIPAAGVVKAQVGAVNSNTQGFVTPAPHTTFDPITKEETAVLGYVRVPAEFYYPYVHVGGFSVNYFDEFLTQGVWTLEASYTHGLPISTLNPFGNGIKKKDTILGALNLDRPTWIRFLNPRSTWLIIGQLDFNYIRNHDKIRQIGTSATGAPQYDGDVGLPNSELIPELVDGPSRIDELKELELLSLLVATTFYKGGTVAPLLAWISDWANAPSMAFIVGLDYYPTNNIIVSPVLRIFTNFGRVVDEPWGIGRLSQWDELQLKFTYQF